MKTQTQLVNNIIGQLNGVKTMMEQDKDCFDTLTQLKAAKSALNSLTMKFLQENFIKCINKCSTKESKEETCKKFFGEILK
ncbi:metal-sensitive transcriptional regulator [Candidatus Peregrinibacteria bacterium]|jgi:CsoR family transcriptional regulator, copper-sensing transcriptional repressor|nr:metal-sensitive transcriptional regulator [Candidatus Peregrinibacteria bacterium]MBT4055923.1 metal-sensitive transcriptional regulator [Candidatus Peregrinibacteria bacterium]